MFDIAINNGLIVDGTRRKPYIGAIGINDDRIEEINKDTKVLSGKLEIDAKGLVVSPGFIDIHSHSDSTFLLDNRCESKIYQGVATEVIGNCGDSLVPNRKETFKEFRTYIEGACIGTKSINWAFDSLDGYVRELKKSKISVNCLPLIGHGALRASVMGYENRAPKSSEMEKMKDLLTRELRSGAWGLSLGLIYPPGCFSRTDELIELGKVLYENNGILTAHIRGESDEVFGAVEEMIDIGRKTGVHIHISHLKLMGKNQWGKAGALLSKIKGFAEEGGNISCDQYPYEASMTSLSTLVPKWAHGGGKEEMLKKLNGINGSRILEEINEEMTRRGGADRIFIMSSRYGTNEWEGKSIQEISRIIGKEPCETVREILNRNSGSIKAVFHTMNEGDVKTIIKDLNVSVGSDGYGLDYEGKICEGISHPRSYGTFPRFIRISREDSLLTIEDAIYKITGLPAKHMGLKERGVIKIYNKADIVIFNYNDIRDTATYINPFSKPEGIHHLIISGKLVIYNGVQTMERPGEVILKN